MENISKDQLNGIYSDLCNLIGLENTLVIYSEFKGEQITFPMRLMSKEFSEKSICERYDGTNLKQLAKEYDYSERWVREIINKNNLKGVG
ncbi:MAG: Mor transcription activator family protein [Acutalibacteraceae bacterium]